jgi:hypothetical protein
MLDNDNEVCISWWFVIMHLFGKTDKFAKIIYMEKK